MRIKHDFPSNKLSPKKEYLQDNLLEQIKPQAEL
jgi:hypothetical protein